jgi:hypothetical protein
MHYTKLIPAVLLAARMALGAPPADDTNKAAPSAGSSGNASPSGTAIPPVLRNYDQQDSLIVMLPGPAASTPAPAPRSLNPAAAGVAASPAKMPPAPDPERPVLHRAAPAYPAEFGTESALYCQKQIGTWTLDDAYALFGDARSHRPSLDDEGGENGDIFGFSDPSSRYRELELDFDRETGTLRTVFAYPWKMSWQECRKLWGVHVSAADADKGRTFYSYLDRRLDVLVDPTGKVISFGLY